MSQHSTTYEVERVTADSVEYTDLRVRYDYHPASSAVYYGNYPCPAEPALVEIDDVRDPAGNEFTMTDHEMDALLVHIAENHLEWQREYA